MTYIDEDTTYRTANDDQKESSGIRVEFGDMALTRDVSDTNNVTTIIQGFANMADDPRLEQAFALIRAVVSDADKRAQEDILARISGKSAPSVSPSIPEGKEPRAPRGSAAALIDRALKEAGDEGLTVLDILAKAETDYEKMVSPSAVRNWLRESELRNPPRYRQHAGVWYLAGRGPALKVVQK